IAYVSYQLDIEDDDWIFEDENKISIEYHIKSEDGYLDQLVGKTDGATIGKGALHYREEIEIKIPRHKDEIKKEIQTWTVTAYIKATGGAKIPPISQDIKVVSNNIDKDRKDFLSSFGYKKSDTSKNAKLGSAAFMIDDNFELNQTISGTAVFALADSSLDGKMHYMEYWVALYNNNGDEVAKDDISGLSNSGDGKTIKKPFSFNLSNINEKYQRFGLEVRLEIKVISARDEKIFQSSKHKNLAKKIYWEREEERIEKRSYIIKKGDTYKKIFTDSKKIGREFDMLPIISENKMFTTINLSKINITIKDILEKHKHVHRWELDKLNPKVTEGKKSNDLIGGLQGTNLIIPKQLHPDQEIKY
ncbi:MAG: hypothetical protein MK207_13930, partial [Saprospiraceae bacterium]|nr:hypothetical protein [Saprospiraceae bacterium]